MKKKPIKPKTDSLESVGRGCDRHLKEKGLETSPALRHRHSGWGFYKRKAEEMVTLMKRTDEA